MLGMGSMCVPAPSLSPPPGPAPGAPCLTVEWNSSELKDVVSWERSSGKLEVIIRPSLLNNPLSFLLPMRLLFILETFFKYT